MQITLDHKTFQVLDDSGLEIITTTTEALYKIIAKAPDDQQIEITKQALESLANDATLYERIRKLNASKGSKGWEGMSKEERSAKAKKAVEARIAKYNQTRRK